VACATAITRLTRCSPTVREENNLSPSDPCMQRALAQYGVIGRDEAKNLGLSDAALHRKVRTGKWITHLPRTFVVVGSPDTWERHLMAALVWAGPSSRLSHRAAAALHGLSDCPRSVVELTTDRRLTPVENVIVHRLRRLERHDSMKLGAFTLTTPARTILDLGAVVDTDIVEAALEDALRRRLTTLPALHWQLRTSGGKGIRGSEVLRDLLAVRPVGYEYIRSDLELKVERVLRSLRNIPPYVRQHEVLTRRGRRFLDFAFPERLVGVEAVSYKWHGGRESWRADLQRDRDLRSLGWRLLYVSLEDITQRRKQFVSDLRSLLAEGFEPRLGF
jgi:very-short-patch-repair endonuclease